MAEFVVEFVVAGGVSNDVMLSSLVLTFINCSTLENWASCAAICVPSMGAVGSLFCICDTSSCRNWVSPIGPPAEASGSPAVSAVAPVAPADPVDPVDPVVFVSRAGAILPIGAVITSVFLPAALYERAVGSHPRPVGCPGD